MVPSLITPVGLDRVREKIGPHVLLKIERKHRFSVSTLVLDFFSERYQTAKVPKE